MGKPPARQSTGRIVRRDCLGGLIHAAPPEVRSSASPTEWTVIRRCSRYSTAILQSGRARSTLDHLAFVIDLADYEAEKERLIGLGVKVRTKEFPSFHWRSLFFADPGGNTVEFVCHDPSA